MRNMLRKGDDLRPEYKKFEYEGLDSTQQFWINRLTLFT